MQHTTFGGRVKTFISERLFIHHMGELDEHEDILKKRKRQKKRKFPLDDDDDYVVDEDSDIVVHERYTKEDTYRQS